jgi:DNA-binding transcriptional regulator YiaG
MPTFADALKKEISRIARKELKSDLEQVRKLVTSHRSEIATLKRELKSVQSQNKALAKLLKGSGGASKSAAPQSEETAPRRGRKPTYSADGLKVMRQKLGVTQAQLALLLEVSSLSIYKWESGQSVPRAAQQQKIFALRSVGKRAAAKVLAEKSEA